MDDQRSDGLPYCPATKRGQRCDLPEGHPGEKHAQALMNPFFPGKVAFIHEWTLDALSDH